MFEELRIEPLTVWHEDALSDGAAAAEAVASYLGAKIDKAAAVDAPLIEKRSGLCVAETIPDLEGVLDGGQSTVISCSRSVME